MRQDPRSSITVVRLKERQFLIPTEILRRCCPALRKQLPSSDATITHLHLSGVPEATFENLVYYFRTGRTPELSIQNVIDVFCASSDLGIRPLEKKCWKLVFETMTRAEQSLLLLVESERGTHMSKEDTLRLMDFLVKSFRKAVNTAAFLQLTERQVRHLLTYPPLRVEHGINATYKAAMRWLHADCRARHSFVEKLTSALGEPPDPTLAQTLSICPTIAREVGKLSQDSPSPFNPVPGGKATKPEIFEVYGNKHFQNEAPPAAEIQANASKKFMLNGKKNYQDAKREQKVMTEAQVRLTGGKTAPPLIGEQRVGVCACQPETHIKIRKTPKPVPNGYRTQPKNWSWQIESYRKESGDSSLTNAEREPSKRRRSLYEARLKYKRGGTRKRLSRGNNGELYNNGEESGNFRHTEGEYHLEAITHHRGCSGDMAIRRSRRKSNRRTDSSKPVGDTQRFTVGAGHHGDVSHTVDVHDKGRYRGKNAMPRRVSVQSTDSYEQDVAEYHCNRKEKNRFTESKKRPSTKSRKTHTKKHAAFATKSRRRSTRLSRVLESEYAHKKRKKPIDFPRKTASFTRVKTKNFRGQRGKRKKKGQCVIS